MCMAVSIVGVQFKSKYLRENKKKLSLCKNFLLKILVLRFSERSRPLWPETCHHNFLYVTVHPTEKCCELFLIQDKTGGKHVSAFY